jgi:uncharacterized protein involved in type VI secretion and phage assembly
VIVGSLWNGKAPPPETNEGKNARKMLKTKSGMQILFDETEDHEHLSIRDKAGNTILLNSESGHESIALNHKDGAAITLKADGSISILAPGGIELKSTDGDINIEAKNVKVNVTGTMDVTKGVL